MKTMFSAKVFNYNNRSAASLLTLLIMVCYAGFPVPLCDASIIKVVTPDAVDPLALPVKLSLSGAGFVKGSKVRLSHPSTPKNYIDLSPDRIETKQITFTLTGGELKRLLQTAVHPKRSAGYALISSPRYGFLNVVAMSPRGVSSNRMVLHLRDFPVRIRSIASPSSAACYPLSVRAGTTRHFNVALERRESPPRSLSLTLKAFTIPELGMKPKPVHGITGGGTVAEGFDTSTAYISIENTVPAGEYEIEVGVAECSRCPHLNVTVVVEANEEINCANCGPLFEPIAVDIVKLDPQQQRVGIRWVDQSVREEGFRIEGSWGAPITWVPVAEVGPQTGVGIGDWEGRVNAPSWAKPQYHCYRVVAHNSYGELPSQYDCGPPDAPRSPTWVRAINSTAHSVTLEWLDNNSTESRYEVWKAYCRDCPYRLYGSHGGHADGAGPVRYEVGSLASQEDYCFKIKAFNSLGGSVWSEIACAETEYEPPPPTAPGKLGLSDMAQSSIKLRWRDFAHTEEGFKVQRRPPGGDWQNRHSLPAKEGTGWMDWTDTGLAAGTSYCYRIKAYNDYGSSFSGEKCATTLAGAPANPDLAVDAVWIPEPTKPNTKFHVAYRVCNMGAMVNDNFRDKIIKDGDMANAKTLSRSSLPSYGCYESSVEYNSGVPSGCYLWELLVDEGGTVAELNESNNYGFLNACFW